MAATESAYRVRSLPQEARESGDDKAFIHLGRTLDIGAFGAGAAFQRKAGETVIPTTTRRARAATGTRSCTSSCRARPGSPIDGDDVDAPQGTAIFVHDPAVMRTARRDHRRHDRPRGRRPPRRRVPRHAGGSRRRASGTRTARRTTPQPSRRPSARSRCIRATRTCSTTSPAWRPCSATTTRPSRRSPSRSPSGSRTRSRRRRTTTSRRCARTRASSSSGLTERQWAQPEPQPAASSGASPSATWNEWPQPHEATAFGFSILNPDSWIVSR